jgi:protease-4
MKDFLKYTCASLLGTFLGLLLLGSIGLGGLVLLIAVAASSSKDSGPQVKDKSVLVLDLSLNITDSKPIRSTSAAIQDVLSDDSGNAVTLRTVLDTIESAKKDPKIVGIYLEGSSEFQQQRVCQSQRSSIGITAFPRCQKTHLCLPNGLE